ncbi:MAG: gliding motility-associated C-terminal domain-containing protein, partial [Chitinophagaceae bacterium]
MQNLQHTFTPTDTDYLVSLEIKSIINCGSVKLSKIIKPRGISTKVDFDFIADCDSGFVRFINKFASSQDTAVQYIWDFGDGVFSNLVNPIHTYSQSGNYPVKLKLKTTTSCLDDSITKTVAMPSLPVTISGDQPIFSGQKIQLFVDGPGNRYAWSPATGLSSTTVAKPFASPAMDITYKAVLTNNKGCSGEDSVRITVVDLDGIYVPTAFTPNNDGKNDDMKPYFGTKFTLKEFSIYNRWGKKVFSTSQRGAGWNGKINGIQVDTGVYIWIFRGIDKSGNALIKKGSLVLIR